MNLQLSFTHSFNVYDNVDEIEEEILFLKMEEKTKRRLPSLMQYGVKLPFRVAVVGQMDSGKTHSMIRRWLDGKILFWKDTDGEIKSCQLQHCLYCSNGGMSIEEKE